MIENFRLSEPSWWLTACILAGIIWCIFLWKERREFPNPRFYLHAVIGLLATVCLVLMALGVEQATESNANSLIVLTPGHTSQQLDSLEQEVPKATVEPYQPGRPLFPISNPPKSVRILGDGLPNYELYQLDSIPTTFIPSEAATGVIALNYGTNHRVAEPLRVRGRFRNAVVGMQIRLIGPDSTALDSIELASATNTDFQLETTLKAAGKLQYQLQVRDSERKQLSLDPLPIKVDEAETISIAILNDFPLFETKYLKNFLAEKGHCVIIRSRITRGRFKFEYFNTAAQGFTFNENNLKALDLLILDVRTLRNLGSSSRSLLQNTIEKHGLGLLIQPETATFDRRLPLVPFGFQSSNIQEVTLSQGSELSLAVYPYRFVESLHLEQIHTDERGPVSGYALQGKGRIGTTLLQNTYELVLQGKKSTYFRLWTDILSALAKRQQPSRLSWEGVPLSYPNQPASVALTTTVDTPRLMGPLGEPIPLKQDYNNPQRWTGRWYPKRSGWHDFQLVNDSTQLSLYVMEPTQWTTLNSEHVRRANFQYTNQQNQQQQAPLMAWTPLNKYWFFISFLLCMGYLWLAAKI